MNRLIILAGALIPVMLAGEAHGRGFGGARAGAARGGSYTGPRGTTVQAGQAGGAAVGPLGGVHAGGAQAARVTTPTGRSYTTGSAGRAGVGPAGGAYATGSHGSAVRGYGGSAATYSRGGAAVGPYGGSYGGYSRGVGAVGGYGGYAGGVRVGGYNAGFGGSSWVGHSTYYHSPTAFSSRAAVVRTGGGYGYSCFTPTWYRAHTTAWVPARWTTASYWVAPPWNNVVTWCGVAEQPYTYDYGNMVVINDNRVYVNGEDRTSADDYAQQAINLSDTGRDSTPAKDDEWQSLGVFGLIQGEEEVAENVFQLAINKNGVIRGNYYDALADNNLPVYGSLDKKAQRLAWSIGDKKEVVFEAGLYNLTLDQTTVLVHYGKERTRQMALVRIDEAQQQK